MQLLRKLNLSIPEIDSLDCKSLLGGNGYMDDSNDYRDNDTFFGDPLNEVVVLGSRGDNHDDEELDSDFDNRENGDENENENEGENSQDNDSPNEDGREHQTDQNKDSGLSDFNTQLMYQNGIPQAGPNCVFASLYAILQGFGYSFNDGWLSFVRLYAGLKDTVWTDVVNGAVSVSPADVNTLVNFIYDASAMERLDGQAIQEALNSGGPIFGIISPLEGEPTSDDVIHAVVITGYDSESGNIIYWDPYTGEQESCPISYLKAGWDIDGINPKRAKE